MKDKRSAMLRRVISASEPHVGHTITVKTSLARYDDLYETAEIAYSTADASPSECEAVSEGVDKKICLGYNGDCSGQARASIPLYSNPWLTAACSNCYATLEADVFVNIKMGDWELQSLAGGFKNVNVNTSVVLDAKANKQWSLALDKSLPIEPQTDLINFKVGPVPFLLYFAIPMQVTGDLSFTTAAEASFGAKASVALGDAFVAWNPTSKWNHTTPQTNFIWSPELVTSASADLTGSFGLKPSFDLHFDKLFHYHLEANPSLQAEVKTSEASKQVCMTSSYSAALVSEVELDINIAHIVNKDWQWGPTTIASVTGKPIPDRCVNITA